MAGNVYLPLAQQWDDDLERLLEAASQMIEGKAKGGVLWLVPARAESQDKAAITDLIQAIGHLCQQRRAAKRGAGHQRAKLDAAGNGGQPAEKRKCFPAAFLLFIGIADQQVVSKPEGVEADLLCRLRHRLQVTKAERWPVPWHQISLEEEAKLHPPFGSLVGHIMVLSDVSSLRIPTIRGK